jgi:hypothetical protein
MEFLVINQLIADEQHGFVPKKGCVSNLLETLDFITESLSWGNSVDEIILDLSKAFDLVPHKGLTHKLKGYGIGSDLLEWFEDFLKDREQRVVLGESVSSWESVLSGVPQGSVLGPLLFVIYINDLTDSVNNKLKLYADDSKILSTVNSWTDALGVQKDIDSISEWMKDWRMQLNTNKCKVIHFGKNNSNFPYLIEDENCGMKYIEDVKSEKDLGVIFEANLKWTKQISACVNKANSLLGMLSRTFESRDVNIWKHLYISMVRPHLEYAFQVWSPTLESDISKLEKIQRKATKIPTALKNISYDDRLKILGLTTLEERRKRGDLIYMFKITKGYESICWENSQVQSDRASRKQNLKRESFSSKRSNDFCREVSVRHNFFINRVIPDWNNIPSKLVSAPSINSFKARLDMKYKNGCYSTKPMI